MTAPDWIWYGRDSDGKSQVSFGRWQAHKCQLRYKLAAIQPTEHDHTHVPLAEALAVIERNAATIARLEGERDIKQSRIDTLHEALDAEEAKVAALVEALEGMRGAVCGETGFAECVRRDSGRAYPWPALDAADEAARAAIAAAKGAK